jgi:anti-anti-sigma regulatory factor
MMILITRQEHAEAQILKVDGHLSAEDTDVLVRECEAETGCLVLDLTDLRFADRRGVGALRELRARGVTLTGLSPYLSLLLGSSGLPDHA